MHTSHALAAAAAFTFATSAYAQTPPPQRTLPSGPVFVSPMGQPFRATRESRRAPIELWLAHADVDGDQRISRDEFVNEAMMFFANVLDANHDRGVTSVESTALWREQAPEMLNARTAPILASNGAPPNAVGPRGPRGGERRGHPPGDDRGGPPGGGRPQIMLGVELEPVMSCDRDFSRRIDATEFENCAARRFMELDVNGDGYFTLYESERAREMLAAYEQRAER